MVREAFFERLYQLLKDTAEAINPQPEINIVESLFVNDLLSRWRDLCIGLSRYSSDEFREWARHKQGR